MEIFVEAPPSDRDVARLDAGLTEHAEPFVPSPGFEPIAVLARDRQGSLIGGVYGRLNWNWLHVSLLWVDPQKRRSGLGRRLLARLEAVARDRGCQFAHLDTFSYQARPFYERLGYVVFGELPDYPPGHQRIFLKKRIGPPSGEESG